MIPEKPKRTPQPRRFWRRTTLIVIMVIPLPLMLLVSGRLNGGQFIDVLLIGVMLCCALYLIYHGVLSALSSLADTDNSAES